MNNYKKYLADLHSQFTTPDEIIFDIVKEVTGKTVIEKNKIVAGEANEVYDIVLSDKSHIIVRISRAEKQEFEQEQWAIEKCHKIGIPVPKIFNLKHLNFEKKPLHICVQEKIEGEPLERGRIDFHSFSEKRKKRSFFKQEKYFLKYTRLKQMVSENLVDQEMGYLRTF